MEHAVVVPAILSDKVSDYIHQADKFSSLSGIIHIDVMDGVFVLEKSPSTEEIMEAIKDIDVEYTVHLMVSEPKPILELLKNYDNVKLVYIHVEVTDREILSARYPYKLAIVIDPDTRLEEYKWMLLKVDTVQIMTVFPGRQGSPFIPESLDQIKRLRDFGFNGEIHADGHINEETIITIAKHGAQVLNVGSAITKSSDPAAAYTKLVALTGVA
jgi:ribulose-phosphate 3-epimerase